ncbi:MAG: putative zinc-binding protein [Candidatus Atribacteria bacterium]|nr:putative zinc-binding protein [Candidatus Atribacteria bacterium]
MTMDKCCCNTKSRLICSCSSAANTGEIADQISRKLTKEGYGNIICLASVRKDAN